VKLKRTETNVSTILQSLKDENKKERSRASARLGEIKSEVNVVETKLIIEALNEARNNEENDILRSRIEKVLNIYREIGEEAERREIEAARRKEEAERREIEAARRKEEAAQQIAEEGDELDSFTYKSRESSKRFPTSTLLMDVYQFLAYLAIGAGIVIGLLLFNELGAVALGILLAGVAIGINMLLVSELIKFLMDFHDVNYINTKVRIKTLEALQDISKKLKK
jgi:Rad3-related DNA helicase